MDKAYKASVFRYWITDTAVCDLWEKANTKGKSHFYPSSQGSDNFLTTVQGGEKKVVHSDHRSVTIETSEISGCGTQGEAVGQCWG